MALGSQKNMADKRVKISQNLVKSAVKILYYQILVQELNREYLKKQEGIYAMMSKAATLKFKQGETNKLEQVAAEARLREFQQKELSLSTDIQNSYRSLGYWINRKETFSIAGNEKLNLDLVQNLGEIQQSPSIQLLEEQVNHGKLLTAVERQKLKPDLKFGFTNQSIENVGGQNYVQAGLNIPIFTKAQKAKIAASEKQTMAYESLLEQNKTQFSTELNNLKAQHQKFINSLQYYMQVALPQADLLENTALKSYQEGEIEYVEMLQNTQSAWSIRENYLTEVQNNNQNIIQIETILGNE
jgi:cobalt-zinc-cadmium resistance protein CzcA